MLSVMARSILHADMDEFFAAVEKLDHPELRGKCLLIGGSPQGRGVVSTASYEAREYGVHSAMPMATAVRLCPRAVLLPVRGDRYREVSERIFDIFERFTPLVEPLSIDEAFLDVTGSQRLFGPAERIARTIKSTIREEVGLTASLGMAPNKFLAKLASDLEKPDGLVIITERNVHEVLDPLPVAKLWGVGPAAAERLERMGLRTIGRLRAAEPGRLREAFGEWGEQIHRLACGIDDRPVTPDHEAKSIAQEQTFPEDVADLDELRRVLLLQTDQVARRLRRCGLKARTVTIKLRYGDFTTLTRSTTLGEATNVTDDLRAAAVKLLTAWASRAHRPLRLLGVTASQLTAAGRGQLSLFEDPRRVKQRQLDQTLDDIADRFGTDAVHRGP
ncbi:MAG TPA: DNA polymerase IV, partial [Phycisphaerae bacterium]|nr:DNA polymerase IV [Phycisphaerae bacterium]